MAVDRRPVMMVVTTDVKTLDLKQVVSSVDSPLVVETAATSKQRSLKKLKNNVEWNLIHRTTL